MDDFAMLTRETAVRFGDRHRLFGVLTEPASGATSGRTAVLLLNAGILHHAGPSCLYVTLARQLAAAGHLVLRFDFSGIGESEPRLDGLRFEKGGVLEAIEAMDLLSATHGIDRFVAAGICSGGVMSLRVALADPRVIGAAMLNPQGYFSAGSTRIESYVKAEKNNQYLFHVSMRRRESWVRLARGEVDLLGIAKALAARGLRPFIEHGSGRDDIKALAKRFQTLAARGVSMLHVYAERDPGLIELGLVSRAISDAYRDSVTPILVPASDHLFTPLRAQRHLLDLLSDWLDGLAPEPARMPADPVGRMQASTL
jgi:pimeloyl-ACP methyl ester carboxylesterase